jgi:hypothetical protein
MKAKPHDRFRPKHVVSLSDGQAEEDFQKFLLAVDSYPARVTKEPLLTFEEHLRRCLRSDSTNPLESKRPKLA